MTNEEQAKIFSRMCQAIKLSVAIFAEQAGISRNQAMGMMLSAFILELTGIVDDD